MNKFDVTETIINHLFDKPQLIEVSGTSKTFLFFLFLCIVGCIYLLIHFYRLRTGKSQKDLFKEDIANEFILKFFYRIIMTTFVVTMLCFLFFKTLKSEEPYQIIIDNDKAKIISISKNTHIDATDIESVIIYPGKFYMKGSAYKMVCYMEFKTKEGFFKFHIPFKKLSTFHLNGCKEQNE